MASNMPRTYVSFSSPERKLAGALRLERGDTMRSQSGNFSRRLCTRVGHAEELTKGSNLRWVLERRRRPAEISRRMSLGGTTMRRTLMLAVVALFVGTALAGCTGG